MQMLVVGLSHKSAPVEVRERVSIGSDALDGVLEQFRATRTLLESVVVSTCNRTEIYTITQSNRAAIDYLTTWLAHQSGTPVDVLANHLYIHEGRAAAEHLFRVASGLDSLIVGETQILGQIRSAFLVASDEGNTGTMLNRLFRAAIETGKRAQSETSIGQNAVSVSYAAVQLAKKVFSDLLGKTVLVLGAGKMSQLTAKNLHSSGVARILIANRTLQRARDLAREYGGTAVPWEEVRDVLPDVDIIISSTGSGGYVLRAHDFEEIQRRRNQRPIVAIDIAVPRDIDPEAATQNRNLYLYDIDDLKGVVSANLAERSRQALQVEEMIDAQLLDFEAWLKAQRVVPLITAVREKGVQIQQSVMESIERKLPNLTERERDLLQKHTMSIVNQLLRDPVTYMKEVAAESGSSKRLESFADLFGVELTDVDALKGWHSSNYQPESSHSESAPSISTMLPALS